MVSLNKQFDKRKVLVYYSQPQGSLDFFFNHRYSNIVTATLLHWHEIEVNWIFLSWSQQTPAIDGFLPQLLPRLQSTWPASTCQVSPESHELTKPDRTPSACSYLQVSTTSIKDCHHGGHQWPWSHSSVQLPQQRRPISNFMSNTSLWLQLRVCWRWELNIFLMFPTNPQNTIGTT